MFKRKLLSFTLAEALVTLTIIGVIAALTVPALYKGDKINKQISEAKLRKFYGNMQYALKLESARLTKSPNRWKPNTTCRSGSGGDCMEEYWKEHFARHIKATQTKKAGDYIYVNFDDGSGFVSRISDTRDIFFFYCIDFKDCRPEIFDGRKTFLFSLTNGKFCSSFCGSASKTRETLLNDCKYSTQHDTPNGNTDPSKMSRRHSCTRLLEIDGWTFKDDYPWKP